MRKDEIRAAELIVEFIKSRDPCEKVSYIPGEDPPDAYIMLNGQAIPLEITTTEVLRKPIFGEDDVREITYEQSNRNLLKEVEVLLQEQGALIGRYVVGFSKPLSSVQFSHYRQVVIDRLVEILQSLSSSPVSSEDFVQYRDSALAWIYKINKNGSKIYYEFDNEALTDTPEFIDFIHSLLVKAIDSKLKKLSLHLKPSECILVIINSYGLAESSSIIKAASGIDRIDDFHTVVVLQGEYPIVLHSIRPDWSLSDA
jgi:hypothetical protein